MHHLLVEAKSNIAKHRQKPITVFVTKDGKPVKNCDVNIKQQKHEFFLVQIVLMQAALTHRSLTTNTPACFQISSTTQHCHIIGGCAKVK
ncbi:MAG: hypothetical protein FWC71_03885 [Defluviitaleaceae bacterium]|nr:hypothetical protein [Defluviitaleaceae bacterium]